MILSDDSTWMNEAMSFIVVKCKEIEDACKYDGRQWYRVILEISK